MFGFIKKFLTNKQDFDYKKYWQDRYNSNGNSGVGSYGILAQYKAEKINELIKNNNITSVIEFGCGDGNQLKLINCKQYLGLDIAKSAIQICYRIFKNDTTKSFMIYEPKSFINQGFIKADLVICLDVLYHITNEDEFEKTLHDIFSCASKFVILYTNICEIKPEPNSHIRNWNIMHYVSKYPDFEIAEIEDQKYKELSSASFILIRRKEGK